MDKYNGASDKRDLLGFLTEYGSMTAGAREAARVSTLPLYISSPRSLLESVQNAVKNYNGQTYEQFKKVVLELAAHGDPYDYYMQLFNTFNRFRKNDDASLFTLFYTLRNYKDVVMLFIDMDLHRYPVSIHQFFTKYLEKIQDADPEFHKWMRLQLYTGPKKVWTIKLLEDMISQYVAARPVVDPASKLNIHFKSNDKSQLRLAHASPPEEEENVENTQGHFQLNRKEPNLEEVCNRKTTSKSTRKVYQHQYANEGNDDHNEDSEEDSQEEPKQDEVKTRRPRATKKQDKARAAAIAAPPPPMQYAPHPQFLAMPPYMMPPPGPGDATSSASDSTSSPRTRSSTSTSTPTATPIQSNR